MAVFFFSLLLSPFGRFKAGGGEECHTYVNQGYMYRLADLPRHIYLEGSIVYLLSTGAHKMMVRTKRWGGQN